MNTVHEKFFSKSFLEEVLKASEKEENKKVSLLGKDPDWLLHAVPYITSVTPGKEGGYSLDALYNNLGKIESVEVNGKVVEGEVIRHIYRILGTLQRGQILPKSISQLSKPLYSGAVPWVLYAFKQQYNVSYSKWVFDSNEFFHKMVLGPSLEDYFLVKYNLETINDDVKAIESASGECGVREYLESIGKPDFPMKEYYFDQDYLQELRHKFLKEGMVSSKDYTKFASLKSEAKINQALLGTKFYWCMLTQTWIFDPSIRNEHMVTSLFGDIDDVAEPLAPVTLSDVKADLSWSKVW